MITNTLRATARGRTRAISVRQTQQVDLDIAYASNAHDLELLTCLSLLSA